MISRYNIEFVPSPDPISVPVTKFGGQPNWVGKPEWPLGSTYDIPLRFICQIAFRDFTIDKSYEGKMAYLFMSDEELSYNGELYGIDKAFDPEGGENAVILQPGGDRLVKTAPLSQGPSLLPKEAERWGLEQRENCKERIEYRVNLHVSDELEYICKEILSKLPSEKVNEYYDSISGNKFGGVPGFIQQEEFPFDQDKSQLILQLDQKEVPFRVEFGDIGVGYLFIEKGGDRARFLWQCG